MDVVDMLLAIDVGNTNIVIGVFRGATLVHLGRRVLRAETAALAALATVDAIAGDAR
jgi:pantothenate kinase type III